MRSFLVPALFLLLLPVSSASGAAAQPDWELLSDSDGIQVYRKEMPDSPLFAFKGIATISAPLSRVASVIVDEKRAKEWVISLGENRIVKMISKTEAIVYTHIETPFVLKDRDFVCRVKLLLDSKAQTVTLTYAPAVDEGAPETKYVRGEMIDSSFKLEGKGEKETKITVEVHTDPKGSVAKWIVNLFQKTWPRRTLENLRVQVAKPDIVLHKEIDEALRTPVKVN